MVVWPYIPFVIVAALDIVLLVRYVACEPRPQSSEHAERSLSVIIPAYNAWDTIRETVSKVLSSRDVHIEVIVVDDGSTDGTGDVLAPYADRGVTVITQDHAGKWTALNNGVAHAHYDSIVTLDADTYLAPTALRELACALDRADAVAGTLMVAAEPGVQNVLQRQEHVRIAMHRTVEGTVNTISGPIAAFRRSLLQDHPFRPSPVEDFEHTVRLRQAGKRVSYAPAAVAYTGMPTSWRGYWSQRLRWSVGTMCEMRRMGLSRTGLAWGLCIAFLDVALVPLAVWYQTYPLIVLLFGIEGAVQVVGSRRERGGDTAAALLFYPQLVVLACIALATNITALAVSSFRKCSNYYKNNHVDAYEDDKP